MQTEHEADRTTSLMTDAAEARASSALGDALSRLVEVLQGLRLDPARVRQNLDLGGGLIMGKAVMLDVGEVGHRPAAGLPDLLRRLFDNGAVAAAVNGDRRAAGGQPQGSRPPDILADRR
jgi:hypothetical protein